MENMKLNNNLECPMLGLGTFMLSPEDAYTSTLEALKMGYSLIDTANAYVNERAVGRAIKDSGIDRKNIFSFKIRDTNGFCFALSIRFFKHSVSGKPVACRLVYIK